MTGGLKAGSPRAVRERKWLKLLVAEFGGPSMLTTMLTKTGTCGKASQYPLSDAERWVYNAAGRRVRIRSDRFAAELLGQLVAAVVVVDMRHEPGG